MMTTRSLPEEVIIEILSWLPPKDLLQSRCVCKAWLKLLTIDPHFHKLHLHRLTNNPPKHNPSILLLQLKKFYLLATDNEEATTPTVEIPCPFNISYPRRHDLFGICNGLLCLVTPFLPDVRVCEWNPLTNVHITTPFPPVPSPFPCDSSITYGFGFCQVTSVFKVIRFLSWKFQSDVSVYTLGTNSWRTLETIPYDFNLFKPHTTLVNNSLHWFAARPESFVRNVIVSFNMEEEIFQEVPYPNVISYGHPNHVTIGELGGLLCIYWALCKECIQIWVMEEYGNVDSWTEKFRIGRPEVSGEFYFLRPLGLVDGGEIIIVKNGRKIILYNPRTNSIRRFKRYRCDFDSAYPFSGSIVSPRLVNGVNASPM